MRHRLNDLSSDTRRKSVIEKDGPAPVLGIKPNLRDAAGKIYPLLNKNNLNRFFFHTARISGRISFKRASLTIRNALRFRHSLPGNQLLAPGEVRDFLTWLLLKSFIQFFFLNQILKIGLS